MNIRDFALKMEVDGKALYLKMAEESRIRDVREIFLMLADAEQSHYDRIIALTEGTVYAKVRSSVLEEAKNVFKKMLEMKETHGELQFDRDGYLHAIKAEEESINLYDGAARDEPDENSRKLLLVLAGEEREHLEIVTNLYQHMEAPRTYLEWGEFSNRGRL